MTLWLGALAVGGWWLESYANAPGEQTDAPSTWPVDASLTRATDRPTLVLFVHGQCPCTPATFSELQRLLAEVSRPPKIIVLVVDETGRHDPTALNRRLAMRVPGATVRDDDGSAARRFGAMTSGHVVQDGAV